MTNTRSESDMAADLQATLAAAHSIDGKDSSSRIERHRHLSPIGQPESVHEISDALYRPFQLESSDNTKVRFRISGCHIDLVPFLQAESGKYYLMNGTQVSEQHAASLGLDDLEERTQVPHQWSSKSSRTKIENEIELLGQKIELASAADKRQWLVWCSHVHGVLVAESDDSSVSVPFSLWGARLKKGLEKCPPYHCPLEKVPTYNLDADDEGTISNADSILTCPETGRRLLSSKMETCLVSEKRLDPKSLARCPINNGWFNRKLKVQCKGCFQEVAPNAIQRGRCNGCRQMTRLVLDSAFAPTPTHLALEDIQERHPGLRELKKVKLAELPQAWMVSGKLGRANLILVVNKDRLEIERISRSSGWLKPWVALERVDWPV